MFEPFKLNLESNGGNYVRVLKIVNIPSHKTNKQLENFSQQKNTVHHRLWNKVTHQFKYDI